MGYRYYPHLTSPHLTTSYHGTWVLPSLPLLPGYSTPLMQSVVVIGCVFLCPVMIYALICKYYPLPIGISHSPFPIPHSLSLLVNG